MQEPVKRSEAVIERIVADLLEGRSLSEICRQAGMPDRGTIHRWSKGDDEVAARIAEAREIGFHDRAERAVAAAKSAKDPIAGRLAFDAERWILGKLSLAFADKPVIGVSLNVDAGESFGAIAAALEGAAAAISSRRDSTSTVVIDGEARSADPAG